ncbi:MAG: transposase, partial [Sutterellaceae bacterium]|nr:transposase [Sutterellaceae bacterium]
KGIGKKKLEKTRQTDYIGAVCSAPNEEHPCVIFEHLGGRTNEAIHKMLDGFTPAVLMSDAYASYDSYCEQHPKIRQQNCIVHWRREMLDAVNIDSLTKSLTAKTEEEAIQKATQQAFKNPAIFQLCCVLKGIGKIYGYEKTVKKEKDESREAYLKRILENRQEHAKPLMDDIDIVMKSLADKYTKIGENGSYKVDGKYGQLGKAIVYYMNRRDKLRLFLTDPEVPLDSNAVERCVRAVAVLRKSCDFKQTVAYTEALCTVLSLTETAKANGIISPVTWLTDFARAVFIHRAEKTLTRLVREKGRSLDLKLKTFDKDSYDGFDITPYLPWNYVKDHPEVTKQSDKTDAEDKQA